MRLFGLIGYPLTHSFSRKYFSEKFEREGLDNCAYELYSISSINELRTVLEKHPDLEGLNVTIPYKEQVLSFLDEKDEVVKKIKACNCIQINSGKLKGHNTDVEGFERSFKQSLQPHHKNALILGTGGAAKAVEFVLKKLRITYKYVSRKPSVHNYSYEQLTGSIMSDHTIIINTTPLGTYPRVNEAPPVPYESLTSRHYLFDLVYNPEKSLFLQKGEQKGAIIKNGYEMLVIQAEESWRIWNS
ncbi:MAG: shikimate dehydrogenase family protein [Chitinophagales bacterium]